MKLLPVLIAEVFKTPEAHEVADAKLQRGCFLYLYSFAEYERMKDRRLGQVELYILVE